MKKIIFFLIAAAALSSCERIFDSHRERGDWSGTYNYGDNAGREYMVGVVNNLMVESLKQMELALVIDADDNGTGTRFSADGDLWTAGSVWTLSGRETYLGGMKITKTAADSTWTLAREGKFPLSGGYYGGDFFDTSFEMEVRMKTDSLATKTHHPWEVLLKKCVRTEDEGYKSSIYTKTDPVKFTGGNLGYWNECRGILYMEVFKDGKLIDKARLELEGSQESGSYFRDL